MTTMTNDEWREFVTEGSRLGNAAICRPPGLPHVTPICFVIEGDELLFTTLPASVKGRSIARDGRIAVGISDDEHPYRFAMLEGQSTLSDDPDELLRVGKAIGRRYMPWQDPEDFARSLAAAGFAVARVRITKVIAHRDLG
jgi:PPOX class probable F420-dependent enzyme